MAHTVEESIQKWELARADRRIFDHHWQEVAELVLTSREFLEDPISQRISQGEQRRLRIFNDTAPMDLVDFAGQTHGMLSNPATRWVELGFQDGEADYDEEVWLKRVTDRMLAYFDHPGSGFGTSSHEIYLDLGGFGTAICQLGPPKQGNLRFTARSLPCTWFLDDDEGMITDVFRASRLRLRDIAVEFGLTDPALMEVAKSATGSEQRQTVVHHVYQRRDRDPSIPTDLNMPWGSRYFLAEKKQGISEGGFLENPYIIVRWSKRAEETYGRGPAMSVLPGIKGVNAMSRDQLIAGEMRVRPPINVYANSVQGSLKLVPGAVNYIKQGTRDFPNAMNTGADPATGDAMIERAEKKIGRAFFQDAMRFPDKTHLNAEQVAVMRTQALIRTSPVFSRVVAEYLWPSIERVFTWGVRRSAPFWAEGRDGWFPIPPQTIAERPIRPFFRSILARTQRESEADNILQGLAFVEAAAQLDPTAVLNVDPDQLARLGWTLRNADPRALRRPADVAQLRQADQEQRQIQEGAQTARELAAAGKDAATAQKQLQESPG